MQLTELLTPDRIDCHAHNGSKKRVLERISAMLAAPEAGLEKNAIFESLFARERLGSTGLGHGVAIPHGRIKECEQTIGALITLEHGIDFDARDNQAVDLLFALLIPENSTDEHLQILAKLAEMFSDRTFVSRLREASDADTLMDEIKNWQALH
jgi:PTS system nitrogen regulatory IIA component